MLQPHPLLAPSLRGVLCVPKFMIREAGGVYLAEIVALFEDDVSTLLMVPDDMLPPPAEAPGDLLHAVVQIGIEVMRVLLVARPTVSGLQWASQTLPVQLAHELKLVGWCVTAEAA